MLDAAFRLGYRCAYCCARAWWFVRRPRTNGAAVALWHDGRLLLIRTSYRDRYTLPGGFVGRKEEARAAAARELREEIGVNVSPADLVAAYEATIFLEHHYDHLAIFEAEVASQPGITANGRELVWAGWMTTEEAEALPQLARHTRAYLAARASRTAGEETT